MVNAVSVPKRHDQRLIIHFDYDCFYAAVFEKENPSLKSLPFAVQQKQIIVTCNYEARRRGLYKLQLVREARQKCPEVIIALGEDLSRFRNASKDNWDFLRGFLWSNRAERLGFDEVFLDVTDLVDYNVELLNVHDLPRSFFHLNRTDPTVGFAYDASTFLGHTYPETERNLVPSPDDLQKLAVNLRLGSHLAQYLRHELDNQKGYTSTVGISTNKLLSKLVGSVNKPRGQTTLLPPYNPNIQGDSNVHCFIDSHNIGQIPGIGFKTAQALRAYVLGRPAEFDTGLVYGGSLENVLVKDVRDKQKMGIKCLQKILGGQGVPKDLPEKVWGLINGVDDTEVGKARIVPQQISIEDSYVKLDDMPVVMKELAMLSTSLIKRMRLDLTTSAPGMNDPGHEVQHASTLDVVSSIRWIAYPKTLRLSTRSRAFDSDGSRRRTFARTSKSSAMPSFLFNLTASIDDLSRRLVDETIVSLFRKLHPESSGWDLSLVNLCATNMTMAASDGKDGQQGRDIARMFQNQDDVLRQWRVTDDSAENIHESPDNENTIATHHQLPALELVHKESSLAQRGSEDAFVSSQGSDMGGESWDDYGMNGDRCFVCGATMPSFAMAAHERFHTMSG